MVELTKVEAEALKNHLEWYIIQETRDSGEYDSIEYLPMLVDSGCELSLAYLLLGKFMFDQGTRMHTLYIFY